MKKLILSSALFFISTAFLNAQQYLQVTVIESSKLVGNSQMVSVNENGEVKEIDLRNAPYLKEEKMRENDRLITKELNRLAALGWELVSVTASGSGKGATNFSATYLVTRYILKREDTE